MRLRGKKPLRHRELSISAAAEEKLWRKGETSGHQQVVKEARIDCDADTILLLVEQTGAACHEGYESCFFRTVDSEFKTQVADQRLVDPDTVYGKKE